MDRVICGTGMAWAKEDREPVDLIVFDMDGVLVDVGDSYRETIVRTVAHFTGREISRDLIQEYKNAGGWNNDWALTQRIAADLGVEVDYDSVVRQFNRFFVGVKGDGLVRHERWIPSPSLFERLATRWGLAIFTGRSRWELDLTLGRFGQGISFDPIVCADDVVHGKPAPDGLNLIRERHPSARLIYVGDTVDDARSARSAGVPFIGVAAAGHSARDELLLLFLREGASAVVENVNEIEDFLQ